VNPKPQALVMDRRHQLETVAGRVGEAEVVVG
jgi:hypothetical protein